ncbi:MAG TPA: hypothetical protein PLP23_15800 [Panacibacter sp.]|nr:hypothetical protein [Panacibacter sp.]
MSLNASFEQLTELAEKRDEVHFSFIKQILLMSSSLFGILVSLHKVTASSDSIRLSFALALGLLSLGILLLSIALFAQVTVHRELFRQKKDDILLQIRDSNHKPRILATEPPKIYRFLENIGYISLLLSLVCLTIYAILIA